jgi:hypothetical protein
LGRLHEGARPEGSEKASPRSHDLFDARLAVTPDDAFALEAEDLGARFAEHLDEFLLIDRSGGKKRRGQCQTHPGRIKDKPAKRNSFEENRSVIQLAELMYTNGEMTCDRDQSVSINLKEKQ